MKHSCVLNDKSELIFVLIELYCILELDFELCKL